MRDEIRKHQKGREFKDGETIVGGKLVCFRGRRCREKGFCFPFFFFSLFPLVCVTDTSRAALTLWKQGRASLQGSFLDFCGRFALYVERDHRRLHGILPRVPMQRAQCLWQQGIRSDWDTTTGLLCRSPGPKTPSALD